MSKLEKFPKALNTFSVNLHSLFLNDIIDFFPPVLLEIISGYSLPYLPPSLNKQINDRIKKEYSWNINKTNIILRCYDGYNSFLLIEQHKKSYGPRKIVSCMGNDYTKCCDKNCDNWIFGGGGDWCDSHDILF